MAHNQTQADRSFIQYKVYLKYLNTLYPYDLIKINLENSSQEFYQINQNISSSRLNTSSVSIKTLNINPDNCF